MGKNKQIHKHWQQRDPGDENFYVIINRYPYFGLKLVVVSAFMRVSSCSLRVSSAPAIALILALTVMLVTCNFTIISAQQQVPSDGGGLTAALNGNSFTTGDAITVGGSIGQRGSGSRVSIEVTNPQGETVKRGFPPLGLDNTFSYSFVAGVQEQHDPNGPMLTSGNYTIVVRYFPPSNGVDIEEVKLPFEYNAGAAAAPEPEAAAAATTTVSQQAPTRNTTTNAVATTTRPTAATFFQSTNDSFRVLVPQGWVIQDLNNTGSAPSDEATRGYAILAQLCPEEQQKAAFSTNASSGSNTPNCRASENDVIHIIRYPNLDTRLAANDGSAATNGTKATTTGNITAYHLQKLEEVGYHDIRILKSAKMNINLTTAADANQTVTTRQAKFVQMTYTTAIEPNKTKTGYFILTSANATAPDSGTTKGYALFYEGNSSSNAAGPGPITPASARSSSLPVAARQALGSFELILAPEATQALAQQAAQGQSLPATNATDTNATDTNATEVPEAAETAEDSDGGGDDDGDGGGDGGEEEVEEDSVGVEEETPIEEGEESGSDNDEVDGEVLLCSTFNDLCSS